MPDQLVAWLALAVSTATLAVTLFRRPVGQWLDRPRFTGKVVRSSAGVLELVCENRGRTQTTVARCGLLTSDRQDPEIDVEGVPAVIGPHSMRRLRAVDSTSIGFRAMLLRLKGVEVMGVWALLAPGDRRVRLTISAEDLAAMNGDDEGKFTVPSL